jgi:hypothetical protein
MLRLNARSRSSVAASASYQGMIDIATYSSGSRRQEIWVAYRVQSPGACGKEKLVRLSRTELFPED